MKMNSNYKVNDFGHAIFVVDKNGFKVPTDCFGNIKMIEDKYILFEDNNETPYLIERVKFTFNVEEITDKTKK